MPSFRRAVGSVCVALCVAGCGSASGQASSDGAAGGSIRGSGKTADGRPIEHFVVSYNGFPDGQLGTMVNGRIQSPADGHVDVTDGHYEIKVPPGQYTTEAQAIVKWHGKDFSFRLETADASDDSARAPVTDAKGIARDYVWKMTGPRPGKDATAIDSGWARAMYGATVSVSTGAWDTEHYQPSQPTFVEADRSSAIELTLTPTGKLIDGSDGKPIVQKVQLAENGHYGFGIRGIPVGDYECAAKLIAADGAVSPLRVSLTTAEYVKLHDDTKTRVPWSASVDLVFQPEEGVMADYGAQGITVYVGK